jgi:hypothetical protein
MPKRTKPAKPIDDTDQLLDEISDALERGEMSVAQEEVSSFFADGRAREVMATYGEGLQQELAATVDKLDIEMDELPVEKPKKERSVSKKLPRKPARPAKKR